MVRSALSANRAIAILDWIVSHPGEKFTLSELSRALGINVPSAMAVLQSLTDAGYLSRRPARKTYEAGPALLAIGLSIGAHNRSFEILNRELEELAVAVGTECAASVAVGEKVMTVADAGRPSSHSLLMRVGSRFPFIAPVGHMFVAWSPKADVDAWVGRAEMSDFKLDRARIDRELAIVRRQGYSALYFKNAGWQPSVALDRLAENPGDPKRIEMVRIAMTEFGENWELIEPRPGQLYDISNVSAPVFDPQGRVLMSVTMNGFTQVDGQDLLRHIERLKQTCRLLTKYGNGTFPD